MRFHPNSPSIPDILLERCDAGRVVFLCGAGVSLASGMPTFVGLAQYVIEFFGPPPDSEIMTALRPWLDSQSGANVPLDQIFNLLHLEYGKEEVNALVTERLSVPLEKKDIGYEHQLIKRISSSQSGVPQIVTTNFDRLFEVGPKGEYLNRHVPPIFPDLNFGAKIEGITYLHGRLVEGGSENHSYVLSSADFGRAYLSEGWATNFIRLLLERYTVVLVGYQAEDPPVKYLLQGLNHDGQFDRSKLYAFDRGLPEEIEAKWRDRGVTAIAYSDHSHLWRSMEAWANRADDPRRWRASTVATSQQDPKGLAPHERGQVAHILRTVQGARLFSEADPAPHPEWVCVMDANVRSAQQSRGYGDDAEVFDSWAAYGLDDDPRDISDGDLKQVINSDSLLVWRDEDDNPTESHRLGGRQVEAFVATPLRLGHLITWLGKCIDSPALAWWVIRQKGLHPRLMQQLAWQLERSEVLHERARHIWNLILESQRDPRNRQWSGDWFDLKKRIKVEGWTTSVLREFRRVTTPRLQIKPPYGLSQSRPPSGTWEEIRLGDLGEYEVVLLERYNDDLDVPDELLPQVFGILEEQLSIASGLLGDTETIFFRTPTCYPEREVDGKAHISKTAKVMVWFVQLLDRMAVKWPVLLNAHAKTWPATDQFLFRKLKLYAFSKAGSFEANLVAEEILSFDQETFWSLDVVRELLFLLADRWKEFSEERRGRLIDRILAGPDRLSHWTDEDFPAQRDRVAVRYARFLELKGCDLTVARSDRLAKMIRDIPQWRDDWAASAVIARGSHGGWVGTDEKPDALINLPVNEVLARAREDLQRDFSSLTEKRPFIGLVKTNPRKALSALTIAGRAGDYPEEFWTSMFNGLPVDIAPRLRRVLLHRVVRLPHALIAELSHTLGKWLGKNLVELLKFDEDLGWTVFDHVVDGILSGGADAISSGIGEVRQGGKVIQRSRRTLDHAINGPIGMCAEALFRAVPSENQEAGSLVPVRIKSRVDRLVATSGESSDHAVSTSCRRLDWLMYVDPDWTKERFIPMLAFDHPVSEPAWSGYLHSGRVPWPPLAEFIKPLLLDLFPWVERLSWDHGPSDVAAQWLGLMRIFQPDEPSGLSRSEMRSVIRAMSDDARSRFISWLSQVGIQNENGWAKHVIPMVTEDWPRERQYRTSGSMRAWIGLLDDTDDSFPAVYEAVKRFLVPLEANDHSFYRFTQEIGEEKVLTTRFPESTLDLMNRATPRVLTHPSHELSKVLSLIAEASPELTSDPRYLRLIDLVERS